MQPQELDINQKRAIVQQEFARRQSGQTPSSAGVGAEITNSLTDPANVMAERAGTSLMTNPPQMQGGSEGTPSDGTIAGMKQQKGEARTLMDAMIFRMKKLTERGE